MSIKEITLFDTKHLDLVTRIEAIALISNTKILSSVIFPGSYNGIWGYWTELKYVIINPEKEMKKYLRY